MATFISRSPVETEALGRQWGEQAEAGWVIALTGDLGAGKTLLVKGLAAGLGCSERVHSPTFSLVNVYTGGRLELAHLDLYRLDGRAQVIAAGLEEYFEPVGVSVIEWAERWYPVSESEPAKLNAPASSGRLRWVRIQVLSDTERLIEYEDFSD